MKSKNTSQDITHHALENLRRRLLDLTWKNRLINFKHTKNRSLRIIDELPNQLVETLLAGKEMRFLPIPEPTQRELIKAGYIEIDKETGKKNQILKNPSSKEWATYLGLSIKYEVPKPEVVNGVDKRHSDNAIQTLLYPYEMESKLKKLFQLSNSAIQEMGTNILYLSFGFLEWFDNINENARIAPLFLLPVQLHKGKLNHQFKIYEFTLSYSGEDLIPNLSLREKLRADFALELPDLDQTTAPETYFERLKTVIKTNQSKWKVRRFITLTLLNFKKLLIYLDLDPNRWPKESNIINHPLVTKFLGGYNSENSNEDISDGNLNFEEEYPIDDIDDIHVKYPIIDDADSSQHSALIDAIDGKNLVIEGPPGTGKSQTITNLIAAALSQGKRILFVAEKLAALEVVRRRLNLAGLGDFCLELHSHKSQKRKILDEIDCRLHKHKKYRKPSDIDIEIARLEELKTKLKKHTERINQPWKNTGKTLHEIFMGATRYRKIIGTKPDMFHPEGYNGEKFDANKHWRDLGKLEEYRNIYQRIVEELNGERDFQSHPWYGVNNSGLLIADHDNVIEKLKNWQDSLQKLKNDRIKLSEELNYKNFTIPNSLSGISSFLNDLQTLPKLEGNEALNKLPILKSEILDMGKNYLNLFQDIQDQYKILSKKMSTKILHDFTVIDSFQNGIKKLRQLVKETVLLKELFNAKKRLTIIHDKLAQLEEPLKQIHNAVGKDAANFLLPSIDGFNELKNFINIVSDLNPSYCELRNELFDNEELDELLPVLKKDFTQLHILHEEIQGKIKIDILPSSNELLELKRILDDRGLFCWFKKSYRSAKKQVLGFANSEYNQLPKIQDLLEKAAIFMEQLYKIQNNQKYNEIFGDFLKGINTNITILKELRSWYKDVRQQYGIGFGQKIKLGEAIINFSSTSIKGVRSLLQHGLQNDLNNILDELSKLKNSFHPASRLYNDTTILLGTNGTINWFLSYLNQAIKLLEPLITDKSISIQELGNRIDALSFLKKTISEWEKINFNNQYFQGELCLEPGLDYDNSSTLSMFQNTLNIADCLENKINNKIIQEYILNKPLIDRCNRLLSLNKHLNDSIDKQYRNFDIFQQKVGLNKKNWMKELNNDDIDILIDRNYRALENSDGLKNWIKYIWICNELATNGLSNLIDFVEQREINITQIEDAYLAGIYDLLAREIFQEQPELAKFSGLSQNAIQKKFREYDNRLKKLQCEQIAWKIDQTEIPYGESGGRISDYTDLALLKHECGKKTLIFQLGNCY